MHNPISKNYLNRLKSAILFSAFLKKYNLMKIEYPGIYCLFFHAISAIFFLFIISPEVSKAESFNQSSDTGFGIGIALVRFDTSFKFTDTTTGRTVFVDADGTLGLPDSDAIPIIFGSFRFTDEHGIGFSYFEVTRESSLFDLDEDFDDVHITGQASFLDESSFFAIQYVNTLHEDKNNRIQALFGLHTLNIKYVLEAEGVITFADDPVIGTLREEASVFAPLPLFGIDIMNSITPDWRLNTKMSLVAGHYDDVSAWVVNTNINAIYQINSHIGFTFGAAYFDADITIKNSNERTDIKYGYDGIILGLHAIF